MSFGWNSHLSINLFMVWLSDLMFGIGIFNCYMIVPLFYVIIVSDQALFLRLSFSNASLFIFLTKVMFFWME